MKQNRREFLVVAGAAVVVGALPLRAVAAEKTKIGIVGSGKVGGALGAIWVKAGHEVMFSSRNIEHDKELAAKLGGNARAGTPREAAAFGEVVMVSVPYHALPDVGKDLGDLLKGKVVIDTYNPSSGATARSRTGRWKKAPDWRRRNYCPAHGSSAPSTRSARRGWDRRTSSPDTSECRSRR